MNPLTAEQLACLIKKYEDSSLIVTAERFGAVRYAVITNPQDPLCGVLKLSGETTAEELFAYIKTRKNLYGPLIELAQANGALGHVNGIMTVSVVKMCDFIPFKREFDRK